MCLSSIKGQIKVTPWSCTPTPPDQCPYQISTSYILQYLRYSPDKILKVKVTTASQNSNQGHTMSLHSYTTNQYPCQVSISYNLQYPRYSPDNILKVKITTARLKVKSRSHHDIVHLHSQTNVPTMYQHLKPQGF